MGWTEGPKLRACLDRVYVCSANCTAIALCNTELVCSANCTTIALCYRELVSSAELVCAYKNPSAAHDWAKVLLSDTSVHSGLYSFFFCDSLFTQTSEAPNENQFFWAEASNVLGGLNGPPTTSFLSQLFYRRT